MNKNIIIIVILAFFALTAAAQENSKREKNVSSIEDLQRRYQGKVVLVSFWATWGRGSVMSISEMEPLKDTKLNHPDLVFVYLTDETSPFEHWQDKRKHIRGEHFRISVEQMSALKHQFDITLLPTYILMDRRGRCREVSEAYVVSELLKELESE